MPQSSLPKEVREILRKSESVSLRAVLISPCSAEGRMVFDPSNGQPGVRGEFFTSKTRLMISEAVSGQILLAKSSILLNVILTPGKLQESDLGHCRFELVDWKPLEETTVG